MKGLALSEGEVICWLASEMSGEERNWERLESMLTEATEKIDVGKEGWLGRYEAVVGAMLPLDNLGRRLVVLSLIGKLEREGWLRGLDVTKSMFDALDEMNRRYASSEQRERARRGCVLWDVNRGLVDCSRWWNRLDCWRADCGARGDFIV